MGRQDALQGSLPLLVLTLLARRGPLHGYAIATRIEAMSEETLRVEEGSLYPALHRLEERGWVESEWRRSENNRKAKFYKLTPRGRAQLRSESESWDQFALAVRKVLRASEQPA
jgi:transcriptional regulator